MIMPVNTSTIPDIKARNFRNTIIAPTTLVLSQMH